MFKSLIQEEEACDACSSQEKQDFVQYLFDAFPNGSPLVERELVGSIRVSRTTIFFKYFISEFIVL